MLSVPYLYNDNMVLLLNMRRTSGKFIKIKNHTVLFAGNTPCCWWNFHLYKFARKYPLNMKTGGVSALIAENSFVAVQKQGSWQNLVLL
jgi:hypothetical protein